MLGKQQRSLGGDISGWRRRTAAPHNSGKEEKNREKKACPEFGGNPVTLGLLFLRLCTRTGVQSCGARLQAQGAPSAFAFTIAKCKSHIYFFKVPQVFGLYNRASSEAPPPTAKLTNMGLTYLPSPPPGVTAVISVFGVREAFEDRAVGS